MGRRVVVTACNMITPLGLDIESSWNNMVAGKSGVKKISLFDYSSYQTHIAGELPPSFEDYASKYCKGRRSRQMARGTRIGYVCTKATVESASLNLNSLDRSRCAVIFGIVETGHSRIYTDDYWILKTMPHALSAWVSLEYSIEGPNFIVSAACASSAFAIAHGYNLIQSNQADLVITGGASSIVNPEHIQGFNDIFALSSLNEEPERASRPFSINRNGFVIGEGAGVLILESEEHAVNRGAEILAEFCGYALTSETYNIMAPMKDGEGMAKTMAYAIRNANLEPNQIDYINAHGTSTPLNDRYETFAVKSVFGDSAYRTPISSIKSMIGHTGGACGAIEAITTIQSIRKGIIPPTINYSPDPALDLDYVPDKARFRDVNIAISNSFGFGGCNATLVIAKYNP